MSKITVYRTHLTPDRNALVDDLDLYLDNCSVVYENTNFQYLKLDADIRIRINIDQSVISNQTLGNYVRIEQDLKTWYYFLLDAKWLSRDAVELLLSIDSINTFRNDIHWSDKTIIQREHRDRFIRIGSENDNVFLRKIDHEHEGINTEKLSRKLPDAYETIGDDTDYYLVYKTRSGLTPENISNPVGCYCIANKPLTIQPAVNAPTYDLTIDDLDVGKYYYFVANENPTMTVKDHSGNVLTMNKEQADGTLKVIRFMIGSNAYVKADKLLYVRDGNNEWKFNKLDFALSEADYPLVINNTRFAHVSTNQQLTDINAILAEPIWVKESGTVAALQTLSIDEVDRTDSRLIKIIKLPYAPCRITDVGTYLIFPDVWEYDSSGMMKLTGSLSTPLESDVGNISMPDAVLNLRQLVPNPGLLRNIEYESKLFHSDFFITKFVYDTFFKEVKYENIKYIGNVDKLPANFVPSFKIKFKPTNTINSKFAFKFDWNNVDLPDGYIHCGESSDVDYNTYMLVSRNNEETIFSNDYLNYIRNGYNYDKKGHSYEMTNNIISTIAGTAGGVGSTIAAFNAASAEKSAILGVAGWGGAISTAVKTIGGVASTILNQFQFNNQIEGKLEQLAHQATAISGADDIDLLSYYNKNKLQIIEYKTVSEQRELLFDLFHYCGYSHNRRELPDFDSRYWFNYIQCEPVFSDEGTNPFSIYMNDIKERYKKGVTVYHRHDGIITEPYDWDQDHENWETKFTENFVPSTKIVAEWGTLNYNTTTRSGSLIVKSNKTIDNDIYIAEIKFDDGRPNECFVNTESSPNYVVLRNLQPFQKAYARIKSNRDPNESSDWTEVAVNITL